MSTWLACTNTTSFEQASQCYSHAYIDDGYDLCFERNAAYFSNLSYFLLVSGLAPALAMGISACMIICARKPRNLSDCKVAVFKGATLTAAALVNVAAGSFPMSIRPQCDSNDCTPIPCDTIYQNTLCYGAKTITDLTTCIPLVSIQCMADNLSSENTLNYQLKVLAKILTAIDSYAFLILISPLLPSIHTLRTLCQRKTPILNRELSDRINEIQNKPSPSQNPSVAHATVRVDEYEETADDARCRSRCVMIQQSLLLGSIGLVTWTATNLFRNFGLTSIAESVKARCGM